MVTTAAQATTKPLPLTDELRQKTKGLHGKTDRLVSLGLFAVLDYQIYRQILLGFYYVFKTFEEEYDRHLKTSTIDSQKQKWPAHPWVEHTYSPELRRTEAFEADLAFFYGSDWKDHVQPSKQVLEYMDHIRDIAKRQPEKLIAYPATLYLGLFFGGQITRSKIIKSTHFFPSPPAKKLGGENDDGIAIFTFRDNTSSTTTTTGATGGAGEGSKGKKLDPNKVKSTLKDRLNSIPEMNLAIAEEAREIFVRNMDLMTSVEGVSKVWTRWIFQFVIFVAVGLALFQILFKSSAIPSEPLVI
ncbi:heme oxygenase-like protein [Linnemannia elongata AG-77]|uniref:Heme oxygenase-like protein n=1 Tax=Linnemannia elongata AG-77 TaxID=1314771 RepID=A0A197JQK1_9FUNG|nr:heme oxygenase-like protein [Linnemannia elongata AG-77]